MDVRESCIVQGRFKFWTDQYNEIPNTLSANAIELTSIMACCVMTKIFARVVLGEKSPYPTELNVVKL